jgi:hypothetical protein
MLPPRPCGPLKPSRPLEPFLPRLPLRVPIPPETSPAASPAASVGLYGQSTSLGIQQVESSVSCRGCAHLKERMGARSEGHPHLQRRRVPSGSAVLAV